MFAALAVTAVGAALVLATAGQSRWSLDGAEVTGGGVPGASALALVALAGAALLLLTRGPARSVLGVLLALCGIAVVLVDVHSGRGGLFTYSPLTDGRLPLHRSVWFWLTAAGGALISCGGLLVAVWGHRWPGARRDYRPPTGSAPAQRDAWSALDRGEDPTV